MSLDLLRAHAACAACVAGRYVQYVAEALCLSENLTAFGGHPLERQKACVHVQLCRVQRCVSLCYIMALGQKHHTLCRSSTHTLKPGPQQCFTAKRCPAQAPRQARRSSAPLGILHPLLRLGISSTAHRAAAALATCPPGSAMLQNSKRQTTSTHAVYERSCSNRSMLYLKQRYLGHCKPHHVRVDCRWMPMRCARAAAACSGASASVRAPAACCGCGSASSPASCAAPCQ